MAFRLTARKLILSASIVTVLGVASAALAQRKTPYWASLLAGEARMRTGPGQQFPASWLYKRKGLPLKVVEISKAFPNWRKVEDPEGVQGWMLAALLTDQRTALVIGTAGSYRAMRARPDASSQILFEVEPGVVGRLSDCSPGWCRLDVLGRMGYISTDHIFGD